jgi:L-alanine-DL-glutamate epimerase-like enolase superfamily enzyme
VEVGARLVTVPLAETFVIARDSQDEVELVEVEVRHEGHSGFGEAAPIARYQESASSALAFIETNAGLLGEDPFALEDVGAGLAALPGERAAKAALDAALHDLCGKLLGLPVWRLLGLRRAGPPTCWTISLADPDEMARKAERTDRFRRLKLKLGGGDGLDLERVRAVRSVTEVPLQVDVNEYWTLEEAFDALPQLAALGVEYCEQPLPAGHSMGGPELKRGSPIPIYLDEDCHTAADVPECARLAHGVNVKLAKSGGIREAIRVVHAARAHGLGVMLGCMLETGLGIAAAAQIAGLFDHVDLDGNLLLADDPWPGVELVDGVQLPSEAPGLGVTQARQAVTDPR